LPGGRHFPDYVAEWPKLPNPGIMRNSQRSTGAPGTHSQQIIITRGCECTVTRGGSPVRRTAGLLRLWVASPEAGPRRYHQILVVVDSPLLRPTTHKIRHPNAVRGCQQSSSALGSPKVPNNDRPGSRVGSRECETAPKQRENRSYGLPTSGTVGLRQGIPPGRVRVSGCTTCDG